MLPIEPLPSAKVCKSTCQAHPPSAQVPFHFHFCLCYLFSFTFRCPNSLVALIARVESNSWANYLHFSSLCSPPSTSFAAGFNCSDVEVKSILCHSLCVLCWQQIQIIDIAISIQMAILSSGCPFGGSVHARPIWLARYLPSLILKQ